MKEKRKLYLLTDYYPYGQAESFVGDEIRQMSRYFDVAVMPRYVLPGEVRPLPDGVRLLPVRCRKNPLTILVAVVGFFCNKLGRHEIKAVISSGEKRVSRLKKSLSAWVSAQLLWKELKNSGAVDCPEGCIYYSFWYTPSALALSFHREDLLGAKVVVRTNGYDLYNDRASGGRQPFKPAADKGIDMIISSCRYGQEYYRDTFGFTPGAKHVLSLLGTETQEQPATLSDGVFRLVSCSNVNEQKRVERIAQALAVIGADVVVDWVHMGSGADFSRLKETVEKLLSGKKNITWKLLGHVHHERVLQYYREEPWNCFITTSQSEGGCPVSIQEAMAFGLPVIGTSVGGITEMLTESENILLDVDASPQKIAKAIEQMYRMPLKERRELCLFNRQRWQERYDGLKNGQILANAISSLWE